MSDRKKFDQYFWDQRYVSGETGWDIGTVSTPLKEYIDQIDDKDMSILIPGCGNSYEAEYLSLKGFNSITLIDISAVLTQKLEERFAGNESITVVTQDFFQHDGSYDLILEQTFFCALHPSLRRDYSVKMNSLLSDEGKLVGILFDKKFEMDGPPFGGSKDEYKNIFKEHFQINVLEQCRNSIAPRSGAELFINLKKKTE